jgi:hypothetical protein
MLTEPLYTVPEAAERSRLSAWTIWDLLKRGRLMRTKVAGKTFVRESELQKLVVETVNKPQLKRKHSKAAR